MWYTPEQRRKGLATRRRNAKLRREEARKNAKEEQAKRRYNLDGQTVKLNNNVVTKRVANRLIKEAESLISNPAKPPSLVSAERIEILFPALATLIGLLLIWNFGEKLGLWWGIFVFVAFIVAPWIVVDKLVTPRVKRGYGNLKELNDERHAKVGDRVRELAGERRRHIEEMQQFYSSPEWQFLRRQVIQEQGEVCSECGQTILNKFDVTVDHIRARSKYPHLALKKTNLRVLCRICNSRKGDSDSELSVLE